MLAAGDETGAVRYALAAIKGVGQAAMTALVAERKANGPFKSAEELALAYVPPVATYALDTSDKLLRFADDKVRRARDWACVCNRGDARASGPRAFQSPGDSQDPCKHF